jgi:hypothetical protein
VGEVQPGRSEERRGVFDFWCEEDGGGAKYSIVCTHRDGCVGRRGGVSSWIGQ